VIATVRSAEENQWSFKRRGHVDSMTAAAFCARCSFVKIILIPMFLDASNCNK